MHDIDISPRQEVVESEVLKYYEGSNVFITGGTGFLGKILIEKLLRTTSISTIYMLMRPKKDKNVTERLTAIFENIIFSKLKAKHPDFLKRIVIVEGDVSVSGLGLVEADRQTLISNVNIIFNLAATVNLVGHIRQSYKINVLSVVEILKLCHEIEKLKSFLHVSTAYANYNIDHIEEKLYDYDKTYEEIGRLLDRVDMDIDDGLTQRIIAPWPNTYTFTKVLGESVIKHRSNGLPTAVFRPSIVLPVFKEPIPGWIDNMYGPTGFLVAQNKGILRTMFTDVDKIADMVPVDLCASSMIVASWEVGTKWDERLRMQGTKEIPVYNFVSTPDNPITWNEFFSISDSHAVRYPSSQALWTPIFHITKNYNWHLVLRVFYHIIPALLFDGVSILLRKRFRLLPLYKIIHLMLYVAVPFAIREWTFSNDNVVNLWNSISAYEQELFPFSMKDVNWITYFRTYYTGIRIYIMKEPLDNVDVARKRRQRLIVLHQIVMAVLYFCLSVIVWTLFNRILRF